MKHPLIISVIAMALLGASAGCKKADQPGAASSAQGGGSKEAVLLKVKWPVGQRLVFRMDLDQHSTSQVPQMPKPVQQDVTSAMTYALSVMKETADGGRELELEFMSNELEMKMGGQVMLSFDSKETASGEANNPITAPFRKMIGTKLRMILDSEGRVDKVVGVDEWVAAVSGEGSNPAAQMMTQQYNESFFKQLADFGRGLSPKAVKIGESWPFKMDFPTGATGKIGVDAKITLKGWEDHEQRRCALLDSRGTLKGSPPDEPGPMGKMFIERGKISGSSWFDPELGSMVEYVSDQFLHLKGELPGAPGKAGVPGFTSDIGQKITVKLVEVTKTKS